MLDLKIIRENKELVETALKNRNSKVDISEIISIDEARRKIIQEVEGLKSAKNKQSEEIGKLKREKKDAALQMAEVGKLNVTIAELDTRLAEIDAKLSETLLVLPNIPDKSVPVGTDEKANPVVRTVGDIPKYTFNPKPHWELGEHMDIMTFEKAVKIAESRFVILKKAGAKLERALINFMLDTHVSAGFTEIYPPYLVNGKSMQSSGQLPKFADELYKCAEDDLYLIPTAEVPLTNMHRDEVVKEEELPFKYVSYSACFRREAGSYGKDLKGLIRVHQFDKVELFKFTNPESSFVELESMLLQAEEILKILKLPYRVIHLCTGDMGFASAKTYDIEVWMPGLNMYKEISSCSNCTDFQARRANIKFKRKATGKSEFVHTLNGSGLAVGRTMAALIENYQQENGDIVIPEALRSFMGGMEKISVGKP
ncbi:MAG: serine--tRNA ligase [Candidatus Firestonebacteria bacterium RIFOXYC2_FULL_39_67]|nr:MAG: serine--tRNA ligase [Candidatus Firestonebacteria bacterium RIFOXYD2_FULL_39_29]OGF54913.1 MAG: serine--tRNA ligase [Candidatus Firestonebacteria bacterium RIFOXYC2_FULL_39_67]